jgi:hypothetical protein
MVKTWLPIRVERYRDKMLGSNEEMEAREMRVKEDQGRQCRDG